MNKYFFVALVISLILSILTFIMVYTSGREEKTVIDVDVEEE